MSNKINIFKIPWSWVPSLYYAEGLPYMIVNAVSVIMYKNLGLSNTEIAFYTGWLYLPWVIKPFWSPFVDNLKTKRWWIVVTQIVIGVLMALVGLSLNIDNFVKWSLILYWLMAFSSATHDIAADGFYMLGLKEHQQSFFVGIRNFTYRLAIISAQGGMVYLAGLFSKEYNMKTSWMIVMFIAATVYLLLAIYHLLVVPRPEKKLKNRSENFVQSLREYFLTWKNFFLKKNVLVAILFILFYRLGEAQLSKMATPFLLDSIELGGLALNNEQVGFIYGTIGIIGLIAGGVTGGIVASIHGLRKWIWPMALAMKLPDLVYVFLARFQPDNLGLIQAFVAIEQFGYGFGFTAFTLYLIYLAKGKYKTSHYAIATGIMALGMMIPGMISGWIQEQLGYQNFFIWVVICTFPGLLLIPFLKIDKDFGKK